MKLVIDIPEEDYAVILANADIVNKRKKHTLEEAVLNGIPLPKGHGDLIDRDKIEYLTAIHDAKYGHTSWSDAIKKIKYSAPTIIEADKEE